MVLARGHAEGDLFGAEAVGHVRADLDVDVDVAIALYDDGWRPFLELLFAALCRGPFVTRVDVANIVEEKVVLDKVVVQVDAGVVLLRFVGEDGRRVARALNPGRHEHVQLKGSAMSIGRAASYSWAREMMGDAGFADRLGLELTRAVEEGVPKGGDTRDGQEGQRLGRQVMGNQGAHKEAYSGVGLVVAQLDLHNQEAYLHCRRRR